MQLRGLLPVDIDRNSEEAVTYEASIVLPVPQICTEKCTSQITPGLCSISI